ncbi:hypothetical protein FRB90_004857, partial [Tulasnella sp. 427]
SFDADTLPALTKWTDEYLCSKMAEAPVSVAVTPDGYADALKLGPDGITMYFTEPHTQRMAMARLLSLLSDAQPKESSGDYARKGSRASEAADGNVDLCPNSSFSTSGILPGEVVYLQSQNGNLNDPLGEFASLREDVPAEIAWASEALDKLPEAVNL